MPDMTPPIRQWEIKHDDIPDQMQEDNPLDYLYLTVLSPVEELAFRKFWEKLHQDFPGRFPRDPNDPKGFYDYRGWWKKYGNGIDLNESLKSHPNFHFTDEFKLPGHPTYSTQSKNYYPGQEEITPVGVWKKGGGFQQLNPFL